MTLNLTSCFKSFLSSQCIKSFRKEYFRSQHQLINMESELRKLDHCHFELSLSSKNISP